LSEDNTLARTWPRDRFEVRDPHPFAQNAKGLGSLSRDARHFQTSKWGQSASVRWFQISPRVLSLLKTERDKLWGTLGS